VTANWRRRCADSVACRYRIADRDWLAPRPWRIVYAASRWYRRHLCAHRHIGRWYSSRHQRPEVRGMSHALHGPL